MASLAGSGGGSNLKVGAHGERGAPAYKGIWGRSPQRGPGAEPLVKGSGGRSPPEAESILVIGCPTEPANLAPVRENSMLCYGPLVSELGGPRVHGGPQPRHWGGRCPPGSAAYGKQSVECVESVMKKKSTTAAV